MNSSGNIRGFSKFSREEKVKWLAETYQLNTEKLNGWIMDCSDVAQVVDQLSENTIAHFPFPYGVAPAFSINKQWYTLPFVTEESSVVAALAKAAKTWSARGGFHTEIIDEEKEGQVHFFVETEHEWLKDHFSEIKKRLLDDTDSLTKSMRERGGGISRIELLDKTNQLRNYFQLAVGFYTQNAMGANFINSCLEQMAKSLKNYFQEYGRAHLLDINMAILSNYTPNSRVRAWVQCKIEKMDGIVAGMDGKTLSRRLEKATAIASVDISRAVTHNKGIFNGIDALALATGNDWRAIEAGAHAYAARNGHYQGLSKVELNGEVFRLQLELPLSVGVVGGVTSIHPLAQFSLQLMQNPSASKLMELMAVAGLASNLSALTALVGKGIQKGHMKMHLNNILTKLEASEQEREATIAFFQKKTVSVSAVKSFLEKRRANE